MVVVKLMSEGYYWGGMFLSATDIIRRFQSCQRRAPKTLGPKNNLIPVTAAWTFQKWGIDIVGNFLRPHEESSG